MLSEDLPLTIFVGVATAVVFSLIDLGPEWALLGVATAPLVADVIKHYVVAKGWGKRRLAVLTVLLVFFGRVKEALARPFRKLPLRAGGAGGRGVGRARWYSVAATAAVASGLTIAAFSLAEAANGKALFAERRWTVWPGDRDGKAQLVVRKRGDGSVTTTPLGIDCGETCSAVFLKGVQVALTATAAPRSVFAGWDGGGCSGTEPCEVTMHGAVEVSARFRPVERTVVLDVSKRGNGRGTVTSKPSGIACGTVCRAHYRPGARVELVAQAEPGTVFAGWSGGGCSGLTPCAVAMDGPKTVTADFRRSRKDTVRLTVEPHGEGAGTVVSEPSGIGCGTLCSAEFEKGDEVKLTAQAEDGSSFAGWNGGGCTGTEPCVVTLDEDTTVEARFDRAVTADLAVRIRGDGTVSSNPTGLSCEPTCRTSFVVGTTVTLTASANDGSTFVGWKGGDCRGTGSCRVTVGRTKLVYAFFRRAPTTFTLTVSIVEDGGTGIVASDHGGIRCQPSCSASFDAGDKVTLTAADGANSDFYGFSGDCSGFSCTVTMSANRTVSALFKAGVD